jgi:ferredoxin
MPGMISAPQYVPRLNKTNCNNCGKCAVICPMGAWKKSGGAMHYESQRCIGCGLCVTACKLDALELKPAPKAKLPEKNQGAFILKMLPVYAANSFRVWIRRTAGI